MEKLNKALLSLLGLKIEKTHTPSEILRVIINEKEKYDINDNITEIILKLLKLSSFFENEGTKTRYGMFIEKKLVIAEELYKNFEDIKDFITYFLEMVELYLILFETVFKINEKNVQDFKKFKKYIKKLKKWV